MSSINDITGDSIKSKAPNAKYSDGWDRIFGKDKNKVFDELSKNYEPDTDISKALDDNVSMIPSDEIRWYEYFRRNRKVTLIKKLPEFDKF